MTHNEALEKARLDAGLTQQEVAEHLGISQPRVSRFEKGVGSFPSIDRLIQMADLYKVSLDRLVGRK